MFEKALYLIFRLYKRQQNNFMEEINCNLLLASFWKRGRSNIFFPHFSPSPRSSINNFAQKIVASPSFRMYVCICVCVRARVRAGYSHRSHSFVTEYVNIYSLTGSGLWNSFQSPLLISVLDSKWHFCRTFWLCSLLIVSW